MLTSKDFQPTLERLESSLLNEEMHMKIDGEKGTIKDALIVHGKMHKNGTLMYNNHSLKERASNGRRTLN
jgi:hypothetical protein